MLWLLLCALMSNPSECSSSWCSMDKNPLISAGFFGAFEGSGFCCNVWAVPGHHWWGRTLGALQGWGFAVRDDALPARAVNTGRVVLEQGSRAWFSHVLTGLARQWWQWWGSPLCAGWLVWLTLRAALMPWEMTRGHCDSSAPCVIHYNPLRFGLLAVVRGGCVVLGC